MGALWCMEKDIHQVTRKASSWSYVRFNRNGLDCNHVQHLFKHFSHSCIENDTTLAAAR